MFNLGYDQNIQAEISTGADDNIIGEISCCEIDWQKTVIYDTIVVPQLPTHLHRSYSYHLDIYLYLIIISSRNNYFVDLAFL